MSLFSGLPYKDRLGNDIYPDFRNMMRLEMVLESEDMDEVEKTLASLTLLYGPNIPEDIEAAYGELLWFYSQGKLPEKPKGRITRLYDFDEDSPFVLAAFHASYNIDLANEELHLHWWQFMSLFIALPEETQMMKRMCDRNIDTTKLKGEMRKYYEERKRAVALKSVKRHQGTTIEERRLAQQKRLDELYAQAERELAESGGAENGN